MTKIGHNKTRVGGVAADQLRSIVERIERMEEEKAERAADIREIYAEAKANGFVVPAIRQIIKMRKKDAAERQEEESTLAVYCRAMGMQYSFDLGDEGEAA